MKKNLSIVLLFISSLAYSQVDLNLGLGAYYPFTGNANDVSGNNNNPIFNNATLTADRLSTPNSAYHFNGVDNYMQIPNAASINAVNQISVCAWVRPTGFYYGACHANAVLNKGDFDFTAGNYLLRFDEGFFAPLNDCNDPLTDTIHQNFRGVSAVVVPYTPFIVKNEWYSVVYTNDGTTARLYVNCELKQTIISSLSFTNGFDLFFGRLNSAGFPYWLNGDLDEVRIYNRPLNQDEITLYGNCTVAPVTLTTFNASVINNKAINLDWNTEAESQIRNYSIERSATGISADFISIGTVPSNNNSHSNKYTFTDNTAKPNTLYYYKLAINDNNGSKKFSTTKTAKIINKDFYTLIYPNPTYGIVKVFINNAASDAQVTILNQLGQAVSVKKASAVSSNPIILDISNTPKGTYWITIQTAESKSVEKIIKQ